MQRLADLFVHEPVGRDDEVAELVQAAPDCRSMTTLLLLSLRLSNVWMRSRIAGDRVEEHARRADRVEKAVCIIVRLIVALAREQVALHAEVGGLRRQGTQR